MWGEKLPPSHSQTQAVKGRLSAPNCPEMAARDVGVKLQGPRISPSCAHLFETSRYWQGAFSDTKLREIPLQRAAVPWVEQWAGGQAVSDTDTLHHSDTQACVHIKGSPPYPGSGLYPRLTLTFTNLPRGKTGMLWLCCVFKLWCLCLCFPKGKHELLLATEVRR